jgi:hypothetical protein
VSMLLTDRQRHASIHLPPGKHRDLLTSGD